MSEAPRPRPVHRPLTVAAAVTAADAGTTAAAARWDAVDAPDLPRALSDPSADGHPHLTVDLSAPTSVDGAGLHRPRPLPT